jgi:pyruvate dehydrogenase phosphatase
MVWCCSSFWPAPPYSHPSGHLGDVTVEHVSYHLPIIVEEFLHGALEQNPERELTPDYIGDLFSQSILAFDDAIAHDVLDLFGGTVEQLEKYSDDEIKEIINDQHLGGANWRNARLCMYGTTALVALVDPEHVNLWVANLGDCQAGSVGPAAVYVYDSSHRHSVDYPGRRRHQRLASRTFDHHPQRG